MAKIMSYRWSQESTNRRFLLLRTYLLPSKINGSFQRREKFLKGQKILEMRLTMAQ